MDESWRMGLPLMSNLKIVSIVCEWKNSNGGEKWQLLAEAFHSQMSTFANLYIFGNIVAPWGHPQTRNNLSNFYYIKNHCMSWCWVWKWWFNTMCKRRYWKYYLLSLLYHISFSPNAPLTGLPSCSTQFWSVQRKSNCVYGVVSQWCFRLNQSLHRSWTCGHAKRFLDFFLFFDRIRYYLHY